MHVPRAGGGGKAPGLEIVPPVAYLVRAAYNERLPKKRELNASNRVDAHATVSYRLAKVGEVRQAQPGHNSSIKSARIPFVADTVVAAATLANKSSR